MAKLPVFKDGKVLRFGLSARILHTVHLFSFVVLLYTGLARMWPQTNVLVGNNLLIGQTIHHIAAVIFITLPIVLMAMNPKGTMDFLKEMFSWDSDDTKWLIKFLPWMIRPQAVHLPPQGKEKAGQKFSGLAIILFCITIIFSGIMMWAGQSISPALTRWAYVVHDVSMMLLMFLIIMHGYMGILFPPTCKSWSSMVTGYIPEEEAKHGWRKWYDELKKEYGNA